jgi:hypothetical protein
MKRRGVLEARVFILMASIFIVIFVALIVAAVITSNQEEKQINLAGGNINRNLGQQLGSFFNGEDPDEIIQQNNPDPDDDGVIDADPEINPEDDDDGDGVANIDDIDIDGDGVYNSEEVVFECGDTNGDGILDQTDLSAIISYAFEGLEIPFGVKADLNGDGVIDILDVTIMINHIYRGKSAPTCMQESNKPPIIDGFEGQGYLKAGVTYVWNLTASDPEGKSLIYQVNFGDGTNVSVLYNVSSGSTKSFSHKYSDMGNYSIGVKVSDEEGLDVSITKSVDVMKANIFFCDFWSNTSISLNVGSTLIARDDKGVLIGIANPITVDGFFLIHTYGDDPFTRDIDEGPVSGVPINFYLEDKSCVLVDGSNTWVDRGSKQITLSCTNGGVKSLTSFACGDVNQDGTIDKSDVETLKGYVFEGAEIPPGVVDLNGDGYPDILDLAILIDHVYRGEEAPTCGANEMIFSLSQCNSVAPGGTCEIPSGTYNEPLILRDGITYSMAPGAVINCSFSTCGATPAITDNNQPVNAKIIGSGQVLENYRDGISILNPLSDVSITLQSLTHNGSDGNAIYVESGNLKFNGNVNCLHKSPYACVLIKQNSDNVLINGNVNLAALSYSYGILSSGKNVTIIGNVTSNKNSALHCSYGFCQVLSGYLKSTSMFGFEFSGGTAYIKNSVVESNDLVAVEGDAISKYGGLLLTIEDSTLLATSPDSYSVGSQDIPQSEGVYLIGTVRANRPIQSTIPVSGPGQLVIIS